MAVTESNSGERLATLEANHRTVCRELKELRQNVVYKDVFKVFTDEHTRIVEKIDAINRDRHRYAGALVVVAFLMSAVSAALTRWFFS